MLLFHKQCCHLLFRVSQQESLESKCSQNQVQSRVKQGFNTIRRCSTYFPKVAASAKAAFQAGLSNITNQKNIEFKAMSCQYKDLQHCFKPSECAESWKSMSPSTPLGKALKVAGQGLQHANCSCPIFMICPIMYVPTLCKFMGAKSQADVY